MLWFDQFTRIGGFVLVGLLVAYLGLSLFADQTRGGAPADLHKAEGETVTAQYGLAVGLLIAVAGLAAVVAGANMLVTGSVSLARAFGIVGGSVSLAAGPALNRLIGVPGIFAMTGILALAAIWVVKVWVPDPADTHFHADAQANPAKLADVLKNDQLARLDFGIFALHAAQMAMFVVVPVALVNSGLAADDHWAVYLPVLLGSFVLMVPGIIYGEKRGQMKPIFIGSVALMLLAQLGLAFGINHFWGIVGALFFYFVAFNLLEASLPSLISKLAPASAKGTAMGVYNTAQALGLFFGGVFGGWLAQHYGFAAVFIFCVVLMAIWLLASLSMTTPPAIKTRLFRVGVMPADEAALLKMQLAEVAGVVEAVVVAEEGVAMLKVSLKGWDEAAARTLLDAALPPRQA